jgi:hypothetical protein
MSKLKYTEIEKVLVCRHVQTLVLDLDDLLVHSHWTRGRGWRTFKRPGVEDFIKHMGQFYEIVVFTNQVSLNLEMQRISHFLRLLNCSTLRSYVLHHLLRAGHPMLQSLSLQSCRSISLLTDLIVRCKPSAFMPRGPNSPSLLAFDVLSCMDAQPNLTPVLYPYPCSYPCHVTIVVAYGYITFRWKQLSHSTTCLLKSF